MNMSAPQTTCAESKRTSYPWICGLVDPCVMYMFSPNRDEHYNKGGGIESQLGKCLDLAV